MFCFYCVVALLEEDVVMTCRIGIPNVLVHQIMTLILICQMFIAWGIAYHLVIKYDFYLGFSFCILFWFLPQFTYVLLEVTDACMLFFTHVSFAFFFKRKMLGLGGRGFLMMLCSSFFAKRLFSCSIFYISTYFCTRGELIIVFVAGCLFYRLSNLSRGTLRSSAMNLSSFLRSLFLVLFY
jgi:hypothetical protein